MEWISNILTGHRPRKRGGKTSSSFHREKDREKEEESKKNATEKQEVNAKENDEETLTPSETPSMDNERNGNESFRGKKPWNEIDYQEQGNEPDSDSLDMEEEGMEI